MPSILNIRRDGSLLHFKIRRDKSPHKILKIRRDWSLPFEEIGVPQKANATTNATIILSVYAVRCMQKLTLRRKITLSN